MIQKYHGDTSINSIIFLNMYFDYKSFEDIVHALSLFGRSTGSPYKIK